MSRGNNKQAAAEAILYGRWNPSAKNFNAHISEHKLLDKSRKILDDCHRAIAEDRNFFMPVYYKNLGVIDTCQCDPRKVFDLLVLCDEIINKYYPQKEKILHELEISLNREKVLLSSYDGVEAIEAMMALVNSTFAE